MMWTNFNILYIL